jgi:hypothetical protein
MRAVDVSGHRRKAVTETLGYETLRSEMITFIELIPAEDLEDARVALKARRMQMYLLAQVKNPAEPLAWLFKRDAPDKTVDLITQRYKILSQMASILTGDSSDQCFFRSHNGPFFIKL